MATLLLDSSIIFDALNSRRGRREFVRGLMEQGHLLACCPINVAEVYAGLRDHEKAGTDAFLSSLEFFPFTWEVAQKAGLIRREWRQKGKTISFTDASLAAVAIHNNLPFLTDNRKDYPMEDLKLYPLP